MAARIAAEQAAKPPTGSPRKTPKELAEEKAAELRRLLTDVSNCHALWVVAAGRTRNHYRLFVYQLGDAENDSQRWTFAW